jgi:hypothetical protein
MRRRGTDAFARSGLFGTEIGVDRIVLPFAFAPERLEPVSRRSRITSRGCAIAPSAQLFN